MNKFNEVQKTIVSIRDLRTQINSFTGKLEKDCPKEIKEVSESINKQMTKIEEALYQTKLKSNQDVLNFPMKLNNKISVLYNYVDGSETSPNQQAKDAFDELVKLSDIEINKFSMIKNVDILKLNQLITGKSLPLILLKKD